MARKKDDGDDIESLLAEAERTLAGGAPRPPARQEERPVERSGGWVRTAAVSAAVAGGAVWVLFAVLPFLRAGSGAVGAFLATFTVLLVLGGRRR
jgi:hypothetical protein